MKNHELSETTLFFMKYSKSNLPFTWNALVKGGLGQLYHYDMKLLDVMHIILQSWQEVSREKRLHIRSVEYSLYDVLISPTKSFALAKPKKLTSRMTIQKFYNSIISNILYEFRYTQCSWLKEDLDKITLK